MLRRFVPVVNDFLGWLHRSQRRRPPRQPAKVNMGCGLHVAPGWFNIDYSLSAYFASWPRPLLKVVYRVTGARRIFTFDEYCRLLKEHDFVHHNLRYGLPLVDSSADYLYASHFIESLSKAEAERLMRDALRVLKPGGCLRLCCPDLAIAIRMYQDGQKEECLRFFYLPQSVSVCSRRRLYDFELLKELLESVGFQRVERKAYREGATPDLELLDNRPDETMYVEAHAP